jgi:phage recombination protein Bet
MTTAIQTKAQGEWTREQVETIKQTVARGASDAQLALFLQTCKSRGLDPFTKQVYFTPQGIIVSIDGFRSIAERTGCYAPGPTRFEYDDKGNLVAAFVTVRKLVAGTWFDLEESAYLEEYMGSSPIWKAKKRVMLSKCAESRALRRAFSSELSGIYESSELDQAREQEMPAARVTVDVTPVQRPSGNIAAALAAIEAAETMDALKVCAQGITAAKSTLTEDERSELRAAYITKKVALEGGL